MKNKLLLVCVALICACVTLTAKKDKFSGPVLPDVTARGQALYEYDQAAWHATDAVQALNPPAGSMGRYIAQKLNGVWKVVFGHLNQERDKFLIAYEATQTGTLEQFTVKRCDPPQEDSGFYLAAAKAIDPALKDFQRENRPYNVTVLPAPADQLYVYVVPAQTKDGIYPLGDDARYLISSISGAIVEKRQLHKSILEIQATPDKQIVAGFHSHVLSEVPEDTDVFHVLTRRPAVPEMIGTTNKKLYRISIDGSIFEGKL